MRTVKMRTVMVVTAVQVPDYGRVQIQRHAKIEGEILGVWDRERPHNNVNANLFSAFTPPTTPEFTEGLHETAVSMAGRIPNCCGVHSEVSGVLPGESEDRGWNGGD